MSVAAVDRCPVLGVGCYAGDVERAAQAIVDRAAAGAGGYVCFANVHLLVSAVHDERVREALVQAWSVFPDGAPVAWVQRRKGWHAVSRVPGPDVMPLVFELGRGRGLRHFLLGSTDRVLAQLETQLRRAYPAADVVGSLAPSFREVDEREGAAIVARVRAARPHVVWCGLGAPKQEVWMHEHAQALAPALLLGVGAAFDFLAGTKTRPPVWMRRRGLEWLGRLAHEPGRLTARYVRTNPEFLLLSAFELATRRRAR